MRFVLIPASVLAFAWQSGAAEPVDYGKQVKPILAVRCYACHGALQQKAGLRTDTAAFVRQGGDHGPAVLAGNAAGSLLIARVRGTEGKRMPPASEGEGLSPTQIDLLRAWIDQGARAPAEEKPEPDPKDHWAFRPPVRPVLPHVGRSAVCNPIDVFLAAEREKRGLTPRGPADKRTLLRRMYLDLIGLPPSREEQRAFLDDPAPNAYEKVVDRLLDSPRYGERWARHWMDVWRYSDWWGLGAEVRNSQKHVWHWRDWIIEALNADKGYDQMVREMLAADELYPNDLDKIRATGFLVRNYFLFNRNTWLEETVEHTSKAFLGLTLNCAKCHDHKYDPIRQVDYYRFRAFFEPYQVRTDQVPGETDSEKDGIARVFDCNLEAPTYRFFRGNEAQPVKNQPLSPGVPPLLTFAGLDVRPMALPPEAHWPGLRPFVLDNYLRAARRRIEVARAERARANRTLVAAAEKAGLPAATVLAAEVVTTLKPANDTGPVRDELAKARAQVRLAEKTLAAAEFEPALWRARAEADRARFVRPPAPTARELARMAAGEEKRSALAEAEVVQAKAELEFLLATPAQRAEREKQRNAAREGVAAARKALQNPGESYTCVRGSTKAPESNLETAESRNKPYPTTSTGRRSALARWLTDARNPLPARVAVNHLWSRHFGRPLVATVFDFGRKGALPTHPELLDWLAVELRENNWSLKHLHRLLVTSDTYRLSSSADGAEAAAKADPTNRWYWRMNPVRMQAQAVRDSLLYLAGELDPTMGGPPLDPAANEMSRRRSLYFVHSHNDHHKFLSMFDDAPVRECYRRSESIVPQQALALVNSRFTLTMAEKISARLQTHLRSAPDAEFVRAAFETVLAGSPTAAELTECQRALDEWAGLLAKAGHGDPRGKARQDLVHALVNHNDFITAR